MASQFCGFRVIQAANTALRVIASDNTGGKNVNLRIDPMRAVKQPSRADLGGRKLQMQTAQVRSIHEFVGNRELCERCERSRKDPMHDLPAHMRQPSLAEANRIAKLKLIEVWRRLATAEEFLKRKRNRRKQ